GSDDHVSAVGSRGETYFYPAKSVGDDEHGSAGVHSARFTPKSAIAFPGPDPSYTRPTTRYVTARELAADLRAADASALRPQPAHWPLVLMLTLLPWAICLQALLLAPLRDVPTRHGAPSGLVTYYITNPAACLALLPLALGALGLAAATFHLGQPLRAWRVFLGLRTSWFSREAVLFGAWFGLTMLAALFPGVPAMTAFAAATGLAALACSVMIYVDTHRSFWRAASTAPRFVLGGAMLASATIALSETSLGGARSFADYAKLAGALLLVAKLVVELASLRGESASARLQRGPFFGVLCVRLGLAAGAAVVFAAVAPAAAEPDLAYYAGLGTPLALLLTGEIAERYLFFRAVDAPKMPGYASR
ncbi:MAG TPA: DmsC/YnfH family molybdoenzyme membrane anchor subunit, partial [Acidobacteriota bacterium]|nr:DmsC/YnfH family molybdoenzyme membrane anchor subunit [Acidobacteriota bacterium]